MPNPTLDLILTRHSNLVTIRINSLREAGSHELLHCVHSPRSFPRRVITVDLVYFLLRVRGQSLLVCVHAGHRTEPHAPVTMYTRSQLSAAVVAAHKFERLSLTFSATAKKPRGRIIVVIGVRLQIENLLESILSHEIKAKAAVVAPDTVDQGLPSAYIVQRV